MSARASAMRQILAAVLLVVLTLTGVGRALAVAETAPPPDSITLGGVLVPICHSDTGNAADPVGPAHHDCCDACALCAPVSLPGAAAWTVPSRVEHFVRHAAASTWAPAIARVATPRLSQGPPTA